MDSSLEEAVPGQQAADKGTQQEQRHQRSPEPSGTARCSNQQGPGHKADQADKQPARLSQAGVAQGDQQDADQVVEDGQGHQKGLQGGPGLGQEQLQSRQGEGYIGGRWDSPAAQPGRGAQVEQAVDQGRNCHTAQGGQHGQQDLPVVAQSARGSLLAQVKAHGQEEYGQQPVLYPILQGQAQSTGQVQRNPSGKSVQPRPGLWQIGQDQPGQGAGHHE